MAETLQQNEALPASYPAVEPIARTDGPNEPHPDPSIVWQRIEAWATTRWTPRAVVWIVEGPGEWVPPLDPATVTATEMWEASAWVSATPDPSPAGGYDLADGVYRVTATVGGGALPEGVAEAFRRLSEFMRGIGAAYMNEAAYTNGLARNWTARAVELSGAADLLRPYRRKA